MKDLSDDSGNQSPKGCILQFLALVVSLVLLHFCLTYWPNRDDAALAVIRKAGGRLDFQRTDRLLFLSTVTDAPLYPEGNVWDINLRDVELNGKVVKNLSTFRSLDNLTLYHCKVPAGLSTSLVPPSRDLRSVYIYNTNVGDAHLKTLEDCPNLWFLGLNGTNVTDALVPTLIHCRKLNVISLRHNKLSDAGIAAIRKAFPNADITVE